MNKEIASAAKEKSQIFETILSSPGMKEKCKIALTLSRQNILFLSRLIEIGFLTEKNIFADEIIATLPKESLDEMKIIHEEILQKSNLTEFYEKLKLL